MAFVMVISSKKCNMREFKFLLKPPKNLQREATLYSSIDNKVIHEIEAYEK